MVNDKRFQQLMTYMLAFSKLFCGFKKLKKISQMHNYNQC